MSVIARTPDGVQHAFPDGTSPEIVTAAVKRYLTARAPAAGAGAGAATLEPPAPKPSAVGPVQEPDLSGRVPISAHQVETLADYPAARTYAEAASSARQFRAKPAIVRALAQPAAGFVEQVAQVPSLVTNEGIVGEARKGFAVLKSIADAVRAQGFEPVRQPEPLAPETATVDRTPLVPAPRTIGRKVLRGLGSAAGYATEAALLTPLVGPEAAAAIPAVQGRGTLEQKAVAGVSMGAGGRLLHVAGEATAAATPLVKAAAGVVAPAVAYGSIVPYVEAAGRKALGDQTVDWPKVEDLTSSTASLLLFGAGMHAAGAVTGKPDLRQPQVPPGVSPERAAAFVALGAHMAEPKMASNTTPEAAAAARAQGQEASAQLADALGGKTIALGFGKNASIVKVAAARVYPFPGLREKVRLIVQDVDSGRLVPLSFVDVADLRAAMRPLPEAPAAPSAEAGPAGLIGPPHPQAAKQGLLRLTQPGVPEELVAHFAYGKDLHPVAADAMRRSLADLSGVLTSREVRRIARNSRDGDAFREALRAKVDAKLGAAVPGGAVEPGLAGPEKGAAAATPPATAPVPPEAARAEAGVPAGGSAPQGAEAEARTPAAPVARKGKVRGAGETVPEAPAPVATPPEPGRAAGGEAPSVPEPAGEGVPGSVGSEAAKEYNATMAFQRQDAARDYMDDPNQQTHAALRKAVDRADAASEAYRGHKPDIDWMRNYEENASKKWSAKRISDSKSSASPVAGEGVKVPRGTSAEVSAPTPGLPDGARRVVMPNRGEIWVKGTGAEMTWQDPSLKLSPYAGRFIPPSEKFRARIEAAEGTAAPDEAQAKGEATNALRYDPNTGRHAVSPNATVDDLRAGVRSITRKLARTTSPVAAKKLSALRDRMKAKVDALTAEPVPIPRRVPKMPTPEQVKAMPEAAIPEAEKPKGPTLAERASETIRASLDDIAKFADPLSLAVREASSSVDALHRYKGGLDHAIWRADRNQSSIAKFWDGQPKERVMAYWDAVEHNAPVAPGLEDFAALERTRYNQVFESLAQFKDIPFFDNYIGHLWKKNDAAARLFASRRKLEGTKRWSRERFFADKRAAMEAGLEPLTWNPERELQMIEHDARKFVELQRLVAEFKSLGSVVLVRPGQKIPENFGRFDANWAKVYLNPNIELREYFDAKQMEALQTVAGKLGVKLSRKTRIGGSRLGYSVSAPGQTGSVTTKFATPLSVLAHEIGHQLDSKYGLQNIFLDTPATRKELRALADLRIEGQEPTSSHRRYIRSAPEKMAVMLEAWLHAPERFKEVAPKTFDKLRLFLTVHPETKPLVSIIRDEKGKETVGPLQPSLTYGEGTGTVSAGGIVLGGEWWAQKDLARIVNNHMSQDLVMGNIWGRGLRRSRDWMNMMQLGLSAFHGTAIAQIAFENQLAIGVREMVAGNLPTKLHGLGKAATALTVVQPIIRGVREGWKFYKGSPELQALEEQAFAGGLRLGTLHPDIGSTATDIFSRNARRALNYVGTAKVLPAAKAAIALPFAAIEAPIKLLAAGYIEPAKISAWRDLYESELRLRRKELDAGTLTHDRLAREVAREIDNRMGLINYDNLFYNRTLKAAIMVLVRAPGWRLGTARALGGAAFVDLPRAIGRATTGRLRGSDFTPRMAYALSTTFGAMLINGVYHYLHTGHEPETLEDLVHPDTGARDANGRKIRAQFPNYIARDVSHAVRDWRGYLSTAVAPEVMLVYELLRNQSYRGPIHRPLKTMDDWAPAAKDVMKYLFYDLTPISVKQRNVLKKGHATPEQQAETFFGITRSPERKPPRQRRFREPTP